MHWPKAALRTGSLLLRPSIHGCWNETLLSSCSLYDVHYNWYLTIYMPLASVVDNTFCAVRCRSDLSRGLLSYEENLHGGERMFNIERCSTVMILPACHAGLTQFSDIASLCLTKTVATCRLYTFGAVCRVIGLHGQNELYLELWRDTIEHFLCLSTWGQI